MDRRAAYTVELAQGLARFFEPRRATCPWCGSTRIALLLRSPDLIQGKPGEFTVDRCTDCRHVFQNPGLSPAGLAFYYRDFYDGLGEKTMGAVFAKQTRAYRERAEIVRTHADPAEWLDVGCGHGHFCHTARQALPGTHFDGLDFGAGVDLARRHGRIRRAYRGEFAALAPELAGRYDVVSMHHYLEHSTDPRLELATALEVLRPGGLLLIEVPDPESRYGRLAGQWWVGWMQPQHLHFVTRENLRTALTELGFTVLGDTTDRPAASHALVGVLIQFTFRLLPRPDRPWLPPAGRLRRVLRAAALALAIPVLATAALVSWVLGPLTRFRGLHSAYRMLARKD
ncbi:class I SAM-dependent methyltransferase [Crossiella cryophila]|uniref:SAM-dependent methyltransferase n=1 Tax=Crossiella cryophila TaxID=43355 RepID=A0A7W7CJC4_9PSEU|nr:class I SAM-dependent methyltransferase [Crossiella cryophila]MBB4680838.1 SAM-dependent methyltransferase [Crossiella cryophila]